MNGVPMVDFRDLPPSAKLVLSYLLIEHMMGGKDWVTVEDIVLNVGITERRLRSIMRLLRKAGLVEAYMDPALGRRHLYRLSFSKLELEKPNIPGGLYLIDLDDGLLIPWDLTFKAYAVIRSSAMLLYTRSVSGLTRLLELTRCTCLTLDVGLVEDEDKLVNQIFRLVSSNRIVSVLFDSSQDHEQIRRITTRIRELGIEPRQIINKPIRCRLWV
ncbi:MAG: helix-turn-helix domain-containing protein [Pyrobaculum sp.]